MGTNLIGGTKVAAALNHTPSHMIGPNTYNI